MPPEAAPRDVFDLHGNHLHDEVLRIPLILHGPELLPRAQVGGQASGADLLPTLADLLGLDARDMLLDGRSLLPFVRAGEIPPGPFAHFCRNRDFVDQPDLPRNKSEVFQELGCVRSGRKLLREVPSGAERAFDLQTDPTELRAVSPVPADCQALAGALDRAWSDCQVGAHEAEDYRLMRARLRALGYL